MPDCPRCHQPVEVTAIACPYCRTTLKAHGHPGIPLYRATEDEYLCKSCTYDKDDTCNFPQRPYAKECTLYHNSDQPEAALPVYQPRWSVTIRTWIARNAAVLVLLVVAIASILIALSG